MASVDLVVLWLILPNRAQKVMDEAKEAKNETEKVAIENGEFGIVSYWK